MNNYLTESPFTDKVRRGEERLRQAISETDPMDAISVGEWYGGRVLLRGC